MDDEQRILQGLERMLRPLRHEWKMTFVRGGTEALAALDAEHVDVLVTDMRMPGMNGVELMQRVVERHPHVIRIALSGHAERDVVVRAVKLAHQYLSKPCEGELIKEKLAQALRLRTVLRHPALQTILSRISGLRTVPSLYVQVLAEMQAPNPSVARIAGIVSTDPGLTAKVLQLINSAYFGMRGHVSDPIRAVQLMGLETVRSLVLSAEVFSHFEQSGGRVNPARIWQHSTRVAKLSREIARQLQVSETAVNEAFTAGLLHDVGKLVLMESFPDYDARLTDASCEEPNAGSLTAERRAFGATHAEVGSYLFGLWGLPYGIVEAVAWHHAPSDGRISGRQPLTALHIANDIDHEVHEGAQASARLDDDYLASLGLHQSIPEWRSQARDMAAA